jgi:hypothetical protein
MRARFVFVVMLSCLAVVAVVLTRTAPSDRAAPSDAAAAKNDGSLGSPPAETREPESGSAREAAPRAAESPPVTTNGASLPRFDPLARIDSYLVGRVTDAANGSAIPGARIVCFRRGMEIASGASDENGNYRTTSFADDGDHIATFALAIATIASEPANSHRIEPGENRIDFALERAGALRVIVKDAESRLPVAGVKILAEHPAVHSIGLTDNEGRLVIHGADRIAKRELALFARKDGHFGTRRYIRFEESSLDGREFEFLVGRECRVEVMTTDAEGKTVDGRLSLRLSDTMLFDTFTLQRSLPFALPSGLELDIRWHDDPKHAGQGRRFFDALPPLPFVGVQLIAADRIMRFMPFEPFTACGQVRAVDLAFAIVRDPARLMGRVTMNGEPCAATVRWTSDRGSGHDDSGPDGTFSLTNIAPGVVTVEVVPMTTFETQTVTIGFQPGETLHQDFAFTIDPRSVAGVVMVGDEPLVGATVTLAPARGAKIDAVIRDTVSDAQGRFAFKDLDLDREYWIQGRADGFESRGVSARSGDHRVNVILQR